MEIKNHTNLEEQDENVMTNSTKQDYQSLLEELESLKFANEFTQNTLAEKDQEIERLKVSADSHTVVLDEKDQEIELLKASANAHSLDLAEKDQEIEMLKANVNTEQNELEVATLKHRVAQLEEELEFAQTAKSKLSDNEELVQARRKVNELMLTNQQLREEMLESQKDIGEVMLTAKRQATKMISDAEADAIAQIERANQELFNIGNKAKGMAEEVKRSQEDVNQIFKEVISRLGEMELTD